MAWQDIAAGGILALLLVALRDALRRQRVRAHFRRASQAEREAARLLRRRGYRILEVQPRQSVCFRVGGQTVRASVRADYLVRRWLRLYVVEVKSGERAPDPGSRATRRQLREYCAVFPHPVLLLDAGTGQLSAVEFFDRAGSGVRQKWLRFLLALVVWWVLDLALRGRVG